MPERLGTIVRLQVQAEPLKRTGIYEPTHLVTADAALISEAGMLIPSASGWIVDAHHRAHPRARGGGNRPLSVGFTAHYEAMASYFGTAPVGIAGENVIVDGPPVRLHDIEGGMLIRRSSGAEVPLTAPRVAAPCLPFTSFMVGSDEVLERETIAAELDFLSRGTRGFVVTMPEIRTYVEISVGDELFIE